MMGAPSTNVNHEQSANFSSKNSEGLKTSLHPLPRGYGKNHCHPGMRNNQSGCDGTSLQNERINYNNTILPF